LKLSTWALFVPRSGKINLHLNLIATALIHDLAAEVAAAYPGGGTYGCVAKPALRFGDVLAARTINF
jgi:hypothetical protein